MSDDSSENKIPKLRLSSAAESADASTNKSKTPPKAKKLDKTKPLLGEEDPLAGLSIRKPKASPKTKKPTSNISPPIGSESTPSNTEVPKPTPKLKKTPLPTESESTATPPPLPKRSSPPPLKNKLKTVGSPPPIAPKAPPSDRDGNSAYDPNDPFADILGSKTPKTSKSSPQKKKTTLKTTATETPPAAAAIPALTSRNNPTEGTSPLTGSRESAYTDPVNENEEKSTLRSLLTVIILLVIFLGLGFALVHFLSNQETTEEAVTEELPPDVNLNIQNQLKNKISIDQPNNEEPKAIDVLDRADLDLSTIDDSVANAIKQAAQNPATLDESLRPEVLKFLANNTFDAVRNGKNARILLYGEAYEIGDTVEPTTDLVFIGARNQELLFQDRNNIIYVKRF